MTGKLKDFKKLFHSPLTQLEIMDVLEINHREYKELLKEVKIELGLPSSSRRHPKSYWKYSEDSYYILKRVGEDSEIIFYYPTREIAEIKLNHLNVNDSVVHEIGQATDENLLKLIREEPNWEDNLDCKYIMKKCNLPYHKSYYLLNLLKNQLSEKTVQDTRFIYKYAPTQKFVIKKYINDEYIIFGYYDDLDMAVKMRDYLESINWDMSNDDNN